MSLHHFNLSQGFLGIYYFASLGLRGSPPEFRLQCLKRRIAVTFLAFEEAQTFADHFACRLITAGGDACLHEFVEFRSQ